MPLPDQPAPTYDVKNAGDEPESRPASVPAAPRMVRVCRAVQRYEKRVTGYMVTYDYSGHTFTNLMSFDPGARVKVSLIVEPTGEP